MARVVRPSVRPSVNIWLCTGVTICRISFNFSDIIHLVCPIHDTGNGHWSSSNMRTLTQLLIFAFCSLLKPFFKLEPSNLVQLEHWTDYNWNKFRGFSIVAKWYFEQLLDTFSYYVHWEGTVYGITKKILFLFISYHIYIFIRARPWTLSKTSIAAH